MDETINKALLSGQFDVLADENLLEGWPDALGRLSEQVFAWYCHQSKTGGEPLQREIDFHLRVKFGVGPNSSPEDSDYLRLARYFAACDVLGGFGWWRDRGGIRIHLFWELQHLHARMAIGHFRQPDRHFLFTLADSGAVVAVDGHLPEGLALGPGEWEELQQVMLCLREIQLDRQQRIYQRMMDEAH